MNRFRLLTVGAVAASALVSVAAYAAVSSDTPPSASAATGGLPVIYADPNFGGPITKTDAGSGPVEIHFVDARGQSQTLTVTESPWSTWGLRGLYATSGTVSGEVGAVTGIGTVANNYTFDVTPGGIKYAVCLTFQKSQETSLRYSEARGWQVVIPPASPCPPPGSD
jgi:hypothetical protein